MILSIITILEIVAIVALHVIIHEAGHAVVTHAVGAKVTKVGWDRIGPYVRHTIPSSNLRSILIAFGGPGANLLTALVLWYFGYSGNAITTPLLFGLFNLLPFKNYDGSHILQYLLTPQEK